MLRRCLYGLILSVGLLLSPSTRAHAHSDFPIAGEEEAVQIGPGGFSAWPLPVHYHRLVGRFQVAEPAGGTVRLLVLTEEGFARFQAGEPVEPVHAWGPAGSGTMNRLIACCPDQLYAQHHLVMTGGGGAAVTVRLKAHLIHDGFAVIAYNAEPGAWTMSALIGVIIFGPITRSMVRRARQGAAAGSRRRMLWLVAGSLSVVAACTLLLWAAAATGARLYGGTLVEGLPAALVDLPLPGGPFGDVMTMALLVPTLAWIAAVLLWGRALAAAAHTGSRPVAGAGLLMAVLVCSGGAAIAWNYAAPAPFLLSFLPALPPLGGSLYLLFRARRQPGTGAA